MTDPKPKIAYQGEPGANSHVACNNRFPDHEPLPCATFEDAFAAVHDGRAALGMIPIENSVAGRVADIHHLLPNAGLYIIGEYFLPIRHQLVGIKGAPLGDVKRVRSHIMALGQCRIAIAELGLQTLVAADTAGAAREIAELGNPSEAAIASDLAADIYGLDILRADIEDADHNTTRFIIMSREDERVALADDQPVITSLIFKVRNVPAALYKALGGFATNGINMTKLESYQLDGRFSATQFYLEVEGHPDSEAMGHALDDLHHYSESVTVLGVYAPHQYRLDQAAAQ